MGFKETVDVVQAHIPLQIGLAILSKYAYYVNNIENNFFCIVLGDEIWLKR